MENIRVDRYKMSKARLEIAKGIKAFFKKYNSEIMALATPEEIAYAVDILPSEEFLWANGVSSYTMMDYEWQNLREIMMKDYRHAVRYGKVEYVTDDGEHIFNSPSGNEYFFVVYNRSNYTGKLYVVYKGDDSYMADLRHRQSEGSILMEVKEENKVRCLPKKWETIGKKLGLRD